MCKYVRIDFTADFRLLLGGAWRRPEETRRDTPQAPTSAALARRRFRPTCAPSVLPEPIEAVGAQLGISHRVHDVAVAQEVLQRSGIDAVIGELEAAGVAQHV